MNQRNLIFKTMLGLLLIAAAFLLLSSDAFATSIQGIQPGTVRVNNLSCVEALFNILANGAEVVDIIVASAILTTVPRVYAINKRSAIRRIVTSAVFLGAGLSTPSTVNMLVITARDTNLFS